MTFNLSGPSASSYSISNALLQFTVYQDVFGWYVPPTLSIGFDSSDTNNVTFRVFAFNISGITAPILLVGVGLCNKVSMTGPSIYANYTANAQYQLYSYDESQYMLIFSNFGYNKVVIRNLRALQCYTLTVVASSAFNINAT